MAVNTTLDVDIIVIAGVGRAKLEVLDREQLIGTVAPAFCRFRFQWAAAAAAPVGRLKWAVAVPSPPLDDSDPASTTLVDHFPAQDIQATVRLALDLSGPSASAAAVEVHAFFAPRVHIRPDWASEQYRGGETGGT